MKAAFIRRPGPPESIEYGELPTPKPQGSEVLVRVGAVAVNPIDTYIRSGAVAVELPTPFVVGCDLAGVVEAVGPDARRFRPGDRVWGSNQGMKGRQGVFSEYAAVDERWLYPTPPGVSDRDVAAVALVGITAHLGLFRHAKLLPDEVVFVNGGSGGVGSCVIQAAKAAGARVIATGGTADKLEICRELGADLAVNYRTDDIEAAVRRFAPDGVHLWWETVREPDLVRAVSLLALRGRLVLMAGRQATPVFPVGPFYVKDCSVHGFAMFNATPDEQREAADEISRLLLEGLLRPRIGRLMRLSETAAAHRLQEDNTLQCAGTLAGKIVLEP